jgi:hypothetical protein
MVDSRLEFDNEWKMVMPICDRCEVAYLDREHHKCEAARGRKALSTTSTTLAGAVAGAVGCAILLAWVDLLFGWSSYPPLFGLLVGVPLGATIGAVAGGRRANRRSD